MKIRLSFFIKDFFYTAPIVVQKHSLIKNQVLNVSLFHNEDLIGQIDLCALPYFHQYNLLEWKYFLENFFLTYDLNLEEIKLDHPFFNMIRPIHHSYYDREIEREVEGEILFIIECILFKVMEEYAPDALSFIKKNPIEIVKINELYHSQSDLLKKDSLPQCLKIKIRPNLQNLNETIELIQFLLKTKPDILLRLDGNRCFEIEDLSSFMEILEKNCGPSLPFIIQYIEEPFKNAYDCFSFYKTSPYAYPIAIDESLAVYRNQLHRLKIFPRGLNIILKPSLFGISKSFEILKYAETLHHNVIISSTYETSTGVRPLFYLAAMNPKTHHGLDTNKFLPKDLAIKHKGRFLNF